MTNATAALSMLIVQEKDCHWQMQLTGDVHAVSSGVWSACHPSHRFLQQILRNKVTSASRYLSARRRAAADHRAGCTSCSRINVVFAASASAGMTSMQHTSLAKNCADSGQVHLLQDWNSLTAAEQQELAADIQAGESLAR